MRLAPLGNAVAPCITFSSHSRLAGAACNWLICAHKQTPAYTAAETVKDNKEEATKGRNKRNGMTQSADFFDGKRMEQCDGRVGYGYYY